MNTDATSSGRRRPSIELIAVVVAIALVVAGGVVWFLVSTSIGGPLVLAGGVLVFGLNLRRSRAQR